MIITMISITSTVGIINTTASFVGRTEVNDPSPIISSLGVVGMSGIVPNTGTRSCKREITCSPKMNASEEENYEIVKNV